MAYSSMTFDDNDSSTPVSAANLNNMIQGIDQLASEKMDKNVVAISDSVATLRDIAAQIVGTNSSGSVYGNGTYVIYLGSGHPANPFSGKYTTVIITAYKSICNFIAIADGNMASAKLVDNVAGTWQTVALNSKVYLLSGKTLIPNGANLNDYTTVGTYMTGGYSDISNITNAPFANPFMLTVEITISGYKRQVVELFTGVAFATRSINYDGTFGSWVICDARYTSDQTAYGLTFSVSKVGHVVTVAIQGTTSAQIPAWTWVATIPAGYRPKYVSAATLKTDDTGTYFSIGASDGSVKPAASIASGVKVTHFCSYVTA